MPSYNMIIALNQSFLRVKEYFNIVIHWYISQALNKVLIQGFVSNKCSPACTGVFQTEFYKLNLIFLRQMTEHQLCHNPANILLSTLGPDNYFPLLLVLCDLNKLCCNSTNCSRVKTNLCFKPNCSNNKFDNLNDTTQLQF